LSELTCDFVRLWQGEKLQHTDVRELFVHQANVVAPTTVEIAVGQEIDTELVYPSPTDEQIPSLKGLLEYIDAREPGGGVQKYYTTTRKHYSLQEGSVQTVQQRTTVNNHKHEQLHTTEHHTTLKRQSHQHTHRHQISLNELSTNVKRSQHQHRHQVTVGEVHSYVKKNLHQHRHNIDISDVHTYVQKKHNTQRISVELYAPVMLVKRVTNVRVTRPIFIFAS
jgi:acyl-CoA synthetase (NDP forming)